jgi:hypothetical protein
LLFVFGIVGSGLVGATPSPSTASAAPLSAAATPTVNEASLQPYVVRISQSNSVVFGDSSTAALAGKAKMYRHDVVAQVLADLLRAHLAGPATYDASTETFQVPLTDAARARPAAQRFVTSVDSAPALLTSAAAAPLPTKLSRQTTSGASVSSVNYVQLYSPFMIGPRQTTAVGPLQFVNSFTNKPITRIQGYSGLISSSDPYRHRVWSAWRQLPIRLGSSDICNQALPWSAAPRRQTTRSPSSTLPTIRREHQ